MIPDGVETLLAFIRKRLNIRDLDLETEAFDKYFNKMMRRKGGTLTKYIHAEEIAYRKLQRVLKEAMEGGEDEYSDEEMTITALPALGQPTTTPKKFQLPKRLRGWLFMERSQIPLKEYSGILNMTQGLNIDKLKKIMVESYPDKVLKDLDGRTSSTKPTWSRKTTKKPFKKRPFPVKTVDGLDEDEDYEEDEDDDTYALDDYYEDEDYGNEVWFGDDGDDDDEWDEDQVAYIDEEGWFTLLKKPSTLLMK